MECQRQISLESTHQLLGMLFRIPVVAADAIKPGPPHKCSARCGAMLGYDLSEQIDTLGRIEYSTGEPSCDAVLSPRTTRGLASNGGNDPHLACLAELRDI